MAIRVRVLSDAMIANLERYCAPGSQVRRAIDDYRDRLALGRDAILVLARGVLIVTNRRRLVVDDTPEAEEEAGTGAEAPPWH